jgi:oligopeptide/dipeptide ABC transporter ATP-binding protein
METAPLLEVRDLSVHYRTRRRTVEALDNVDLHMMPSETVGLVGESGSGKSTLARALLGLAPIRSGSVSFEGEDVTHLRFRDRRRVYRQMQIVFQDPYSSLNPSRTVGRTLAEPIEANGERDRPAARERVRSMLERVHLPPDAADRYPRDFSGGQRQRIAIARALILSPRLVILDEALSALDLSVQAQILNLLRELQVAFGLSYLFISHDLEVVRYFCDRVVVLYGGQVMESGPAEHVAERPAHPYTHALHQASPVPNPRIQRQRGLVRTRAVTEPANGVATVADQACPFAPRCPYAESRCWNEKPTLLGAHGSGLVACHRYPEWQRQGFPAAASARNGEVSRA